MAAIQKVGQLGMIDTIQIYAQIEGSGLDDSDTFGSDITFATTPITVTGWLVGTWSRSRDPDVGDLNTATNYRLRLPVGTAIFPGDKVVINGNAYNVFDAGTDQTWPEWLTCIVRRSK